MLACFTINSYFCKRLQKYGLHDYAHHKQTDCYLKTSNNSLKS
ncbi:hypothetical protein HMPREF0971_03222 [Segatella oris F0302]|uniref:Uncharacterized protein n=1 Tax=Segatella oris F0302 TaxID=649760 RepID=D1QW27_9BACT|nr:hypothetical protein HMPREF0971_03222 [Segatella oris F0302]